MLNAEKSADFGKSTWTSKKYIQIRIIKEKVGDFHKIGDAWNKIFKEGSTDIIIDLRIAVDKFYKKGTKLKYYEGLKGFQTNSGFISA